MQSLMMDSHEGLKTFNQGDIHSNASGSIIVQIKPTPQHAFSLPLASSDVCKESFRWNMPLALAHTLACTHARSGDPHSHTETCANARKLKQTNVQCVLGGTKLEKPRTCKNYVTRNSADFHLITLLCKAS